MKNKLRWFAVVVGVLLSVSTAWAAPGTLPNNPVSNSAPISPNIMFVLDDSGSMQNIVPDVPFDSTITYYMCPSSLAISTANPDSVISLYVSASGHIPYFNFSSDGSIFNSAVYDWGITSGTGATGKPKRCFNPTATYSNAALLANDTVPSNGRYCGSFSSMSGTRQGDLCTDQGFSPIAYGPAVYSGNYLNWYFGSAPTNWGTGVQFKPGTQQRVTIGKQVLTDLINTLSDVRVGFAAYDNSGTGADIIVGINDISVNKSAMLTAIAAANASGGTPLVETEFELGRYFVQNFNNTLTLFPGKSNQTTKTAYTVFSSTPTYRSSVTQASPIQYYCQKNFIVLITDGQPSYSPGNVPSSSGLRNYSGLDGTTNPWYYLQDVSMALFDMNLRPDLSTTVKSNVGTYTVGFAGSDVIAGSGNSLLQTTASLAGGEFFSASDTEGLTTALENITSSISAQASQGAAATFSSTGLTSGSTLFIPKYTSSTWSGDLVAYPVSSTGVIGSQLWSAATLLDTLAPTSRFVFTYNAITNTGIPFVTLTSLSATQQADLNKAPTGLVDTKGQQRLDFLRGNRTLEGTTFRTRSHVLADIVDSSPVYVGAPASGWPNNSPFPTVAGTTYSAFQASAAKTRTPVVYVGDNGGMLEGFNANTGQNVLSYIPNSLFSTVTSQGLHYLSDPNYQHRFYVDSTPVAQDVFTSTRTSAVAWRTVLVGGEQNGGRGYFALDVTNPATFTSGNENSLLLWEFTSASDPDLGFTYSVPAIGLMNNGRWAAIFGNGYNNTGTGAAKLFIVFLDGGKSGTWVQGVDYIKIDTKAGTLANLNGLSSVTAVDVNGDQVIDRIYAGDVLGNMWAFDVSSASTTNWGSDYGTAGAPVPLMITGSNQPITAAPTVVINPAVGPSTSNQPDMMVMFGTGQYLTSTDNTSTQTQAFYGVWDAGTGGLTTSNLVAQTFSLSGTSRIMSNNSVDYTTKKGWYINLTSGERVIADASVRYVLTQSNIAASPKEPLVFFDTLIPNSTNACAFGGTGWAMGVTVANGGQPTQIILDVNNDGLLSASDNINNKVVSGIQFLQGAPTQSTLRGDYLFTPVSSGALVTTKIISDATLVGRISWQQLMSGQN